METEFTPFVSLLGGALIGLSAIVLLATHGRIAGISGIVSRMLPPTFDKAGLPQGIIFLVGLLLAAGQPESRKTRRAQGHPLILRDRAMLRWLQSLLLGAGRSA